MIRKPHHPPAVFVLLGCAVCAALTALSAEWTPETFSAVAPWKPGDSRAPLAAVEAVVRTASPAQYAAIEQQLIALLKSDAATPDARRFACRVLRQVGSSACVPAVAALLPDPAYSHMARYALQGIRGPAVDKALHDALDSLNGELRLGVIGTLGARRDSTAIPALQAIAAGKDVAAAPTAINALARIGTAEAEQALAAAAVAPALEPQRQDARLLCARELLADAPTTAESIYVELFDKGANDTVRATALHGLAAARKARAVPMLMEQIAKGSPVMRGAALAALIDLPGADALKAAVDRLGDLPPENQVDALNALAMRRENAGCASAINALAEKAPTPAVRTAALRALATMGDAASVELLLKAVDAGGDDGKIAEAGLLDLEGRDVSEKLAALAATGAPARRAALIDLLRRRESVASVPSLLQYAQDADETVSAAACRALRELAQGSDAPAILAILLKAAPERRQALADALAAAADRATDEARRTGGVTAALAAADDELKATLIGVLGRIRGERALAALTGQLANPNPDVRRAVCRALDGWDNAAPLDTLIKQAADETDLTNHALALRAYIKLVNAHQGDKPKQAVKQLAQAMACARRPDEKRTILELLSKYPCKASLELVKANLNEEAIKDSATRALDRLMLVMGNTCTGSPHNELAQNAVDRDPESDWRTERGMQPGDWFAVAFDKPRAIRKLTLEAGRGSDYPRAYDVYVSDDGKNWGAPIKKGTSNRNPTHIDLGKPVTTSHLKIVQTGSAGNWWRIAELTIE